MHQPTRTDILRVLIAHDHPMQRYDLALRALWTTGYDEQTHRHIRDINTSDVSATTRLIDTMRAEGTLTLQTASTWRSLLGAQFTTDSLHHRSGYHWYATPEQHTRWGGEHDETRARLDSIRARLNAAALPTLFTDRASWNAAGTEVDGNHPDAVRTILSIVDAPGSVIAEVTCNHDPDDCNDPAGAKARAVAAAGLFTEAADDLAFLLGLVDSHTQAGAK
ncbi:hypothetical protein ACQPZG_20030 [Streptomyces sp. CA-294286]|uniref:hypothetical protein n=1 Tax=Streptomyces sp. CA-294286 TaxID=3240070 RepID=UPI003D919C54